MFPQGGKVIERVQIFAPAIPRGDQDLQTKVTKCFNLIKDHAINGVMCVTELKLNRVNNTIQRQKGPDVRD